jgi:tetratricopeptide (TPR) repeat protein
VGISTACTVALIIGLLACSSTSQRPVPANAVPATGAGPAATDLASYRRACTEAANQRKSGTPAAYSLSLDLISSARFSELTTAEQHQMLAQTGTLGMKLGDLGFAHRLLVRATDLAEGVAPDWVGRSYAAYQLGDRVDSVQSLAVVAQRWPRWLPAYNPRYVDELAAWTPRSEQESRAQFELCRALFAAGWKGEGGLEPSRAWAALIRRYVERGDTQAALAVLAREHDPKQILALRVDKRFDALGDLDPARLDVASAAQRWIEERQAAVERRPDSLAALTHLSIGYVHIGRYDQALDVTTKVLTKIAAAPSPKEAFDDADAWLNWVWDSRSDALQRLGRWAEAEEAARHAADLPEAGGANASNVSNLAALYADLGRGDEALATLQRYSGPLTDYGHMDLEYVKLRAAVARHDEMQTRQSLEFLRDHRLDAMALYQAALVYAGRLDEAALLLITRLKDPELRTAALLDVQRYAQPRSTLLREQARQRWRQVMARPQVQTQIHQVGRIETVTISGGLF